MGQKVTNPNSQINWYGTETTDDTGNIITEPLCYMADFTGKGGESGLKLEDNQIAYSVGGSPVILTDPTYVAQYNPTEMAMCYHYGDQVGQETQAGTVYSFGYKYIGHGRFLSNVLSCQASMDDATLIRVDNWNGTMEKVKDVFEGTDSQGHLQSAYAGDLVVRPGYPTFFSIAVGEQMSLVGAETGKMQGWSFNSTSGQTVTFETKQLQSAVVTAATNVDQIVPSAGLSNLVFITDMSADTVIYTDRDGVEHKANHACQTNGVCVYILPGPVANIKLAVACTVYEVGALKFFPID